MSNVGLARVAYAEDTKYLGFWMLAESEQYEIGTTDDRQMKLFSVDNSCIIRIECQY